MGMIEFDLRPDRRRLRQFAVAMVVAGALLAASVHWRGHLLFWAVDESAPVALSGLAIAAIYALLSALFLPRAVWPIYVVLTVVAVPIGTVLSYTLLALFFYLLLTPVGLYFRLRRRDLLDRRGDGNRESYWRRARGDRPVSDYFRQF